LIADVGRVHGADLELPLSRHDLGVDPRDPQAGLEAQVEVGLDDLTAEDLVRTDAAVVAALRCREAAVGESERARALEERVLLLDPEPRVEGPVLLRSFRAGPARVRRVRLAVHEHDLAQNELVLAAADRIRANEHGLEDAVGPVARRLLRAGAIETTDRG